MVRGGRIDTAGFQTHPDWSGVGSVRVRGRRGEQSGCLGGGDHQRECHEWGLGSPDLWDRLGAYVAFTWMRYRFELKEVFLATGAITFIYEEARNFYGDDQYITRLATQIMTKATSAASTTLASQVLALGNASAVLAAAPTGSLIGAFNYNQHNLHLFDQDAVRETPESPSTILTGNRVSPRRPSARSTSSS